ncbi:MAG: type VI secretion system contractile sheath large subunit, partial [Gemmataceae bacterium]
CEALAGRKPILLDRDNFEEVMGKLKIDLQLSLGASGRVAMSFKELDDFRPERLFRELEIFDKLRSTRARLEDGSAFAATAKKLHDWSAKAPRPAKPVDPTQLGDFLDEVFAATEEQPAQTQAGVDWNNFLERVVGPYVVPKENPRQAEMTDVVDRATSGLMRALLHQTHFQSLEAAWRGLWFLVKRLPTDTTLKIAVLDVSRDELAADLAGEELDHSGLFRILVKETVGTPGAAPWAAVAGLYTFDARREDAELLGRIARIARAADAPFLASAHARLAGTPSFAAQADPDSWKDLHASDSQEAWTALRELPEAVYLGLALPRFLLRLPYGPGTDEVESFAIDEECARAHETNLWGNPALACACLLGEAFASAGWSLRPGMVQELENLPAYVYKVDDEPVMQPCAEVVLSVKAGQQLLALGLMPLLSIQGRDTVRLAQFLSLAGKELAGRWQ